MGGTSSSSEEASATAPEPLGGDAGGGRDVAAVIGVCVRPRPAPRSAAASGLLWRSHACLSDCVFDSPGLE